MWMTKYGVISVIGGLLVLLFGKVSRYGAAHEGLERYMFAGALISIGVVLLIWGYRRGHKVNELFKDDVFLMCPKCGEPYNSIDVKNNMCPTCNIDLENVEGFYTRHPEFKD